MSLDYLFKYLPLLSSPRRPFPLTFNLPLLDIITYLFLLGRCIHLPLSVLTYLVPDRDDPASRPTPLIHLPAFHNTILVIGPIDHSPLDYSRLLGRAASYARAGPTLSLLCHTLR